MDYLYLVVITFKALFVCFIQFFQKYRSFFSISGDPSEFAISALQNDAGNWKDLINNSFFHLTSLISLKSQIFFC